MIPEWLQQVAGPDELLTERLVALRLAVAFALGCVVAGIYRVTQRRVTRQSANMVATLVLLAVLIAMVTQVIGSNIARAFSLVGALAIVRFRTVVEDTRDTAFVIFAVTVGMAVGAGVPEIALVGIPFAGLAAFLFRPRIEAAMTGPADHRLTVRLGTGLKSDELLRPSFGKYLRQFRLVATGTARQGAALDLTYDVRLLREDDVLSLVADLTALEGVQSVELKED